MKTIFTFEEIGTLLGQAAGARLDLPYGVTYGFGIKWSMAEKTEDSFVTVEVDLDAKRAAE